MTRQTMIAALLAGLMALTAPVGARASSLLVNGGFDDGLTGWTVTPTQNGTTLVQDVFNFDTTGTGASDAARFQVGRAEVSNPTAGGIELAQTFAVTTAGTYSLSMDVAALIALGPTAGNLSGGTFEMLLGTTLVDRLAIGFIRNETIRGSLSGQLALSAGDHLFMLRITRTGTAAETTPFQFADNARVELVEPMAAIPLPAAGWLLLGALGALGALRRRRG